MSSYQVGIPQDGQTLGNSKPQVRDNFSIAFNSFAVNHVDFNTLGTGWHNLLTMSTLSVNPTLLGLTAGNLNVFSKLVAPNTLPQLFFAQSKTGTIYQLTGTSADATSTPAPGTNGYTWLPGGLMIQWWTAKAPGAPANFPTAFPNNCYVITGNQTTNTGSLTVIANSKTQYTASRSSSPNVDCYFIAIGN
jgi:hypothetical protein